jgi:hypothetical protein
MRAVFGPSSRRIAVICSIMLACTAAAVFAQRLIPGFGMRRDPRVQNVKYDGRFTFARLRFMTAPSGYYYRGLPAWAHGYPEAERNLSKILGEVSLLGPHVEETNVFAIDDPQLSRYPVAYMTEAGYWTLTPREIVALRAYLKKGGFLIFDDFRDDFERGGGGWAHFESNMRRVIPDAQFVDLSPSHPIFHSFFEIDSFDIVSQYYDEGEPVFRGLFEDNDPTKRLIAMVNFNTDVSNYWEFSAEGLRPIDESNEAYKLGVNYIMYGLTH